MKLTTLTMAVAAACVFAQSAEARGYHHHYRSSYHRHDYHHYARRHGHARSETAGVYRGGYGARPSRWCGWEMRHLVGADPGPRYNLARNWARWGHGGPAGVGAVVVWPHHVGKIVGQEHGRWVIQSGNDGHRVRIRPRSIAGAIAIRWG
jgi:hypothetical protein